jgi:hypothetical protein
MPLSPFIQRLAFLPMAELAETVALCRGALAPLGNDLLVNQRIDRELPVLADGGRLSPQLITHLFEWREQIDAFALSRATTSPDFAAQLARLTESTDFKPNDGSIRWKRERIVTGEFPVARSLQALFGTPAGASSWPGTLWVGNKIVPRGDFRGLEAGLRRFFNQPISVDDFLNAFQVDVAGYRLDLLIVEPDRESGGRVMVTGNLGTDAGERCGAFQRTIAPRPPPGGEWRAVTTGYNPVGGFDGHTGRGLARGLHQRFLGFLHRIGLDRMYLTSDKSGNFVWPHLGFRHRDAQETETLKAILRDYLEILDLWSADVEERWNDVRESWDIADFAVEDRKVGREFLLSLEGRIGQNLYFDVGNLNDAGWKRLFRD